MNSRSDQQLLRDYTESGSEAAFGELVRRHVDLVHSAAARMVRDTHLAEDVTQAVFVALARNARQLTDRPVLAGWLHRTAQNLAANIIRSEVRRRTREQEAAAMNELPATESASLWERIAPHLDTALGELNEADRDALLLRYFQRKSAREIAQTLRVSDVAAQKRVNRAVERLRQFFARRGVAVSTGGLAAIISANGVQAAPVGLAATIASAAILVGTVVPTSTALISAKIVAMTTLQKTIIAATLVAAVGTGIYETRQVARRHHQVQALRQPTPAPLTRTTQATASQSSTVVPKRLTTAPRSKAPSPDGGLKKATAAVPFTSTRAYELIKKKAPKLTLAQVNPYLDANERSAASLLAAFRTTMDPRLLAEAMQKYPNDPQVGFEAAIRMDASPEERRQRLEAFKKADPENSLASYLSALEHFKAGQPAETVQDLVKAAGQQQFQDYSHDRIQTDEEAYLAAGYPPGEAKLIANWFLATPQLVDFRELGKHLIGLANSYQQSGDENSRQNALQMVVDLGRRFGDASSGEVLVNQLIGISIERMALNVMDPASPYGAGGQTVQERLDQLIQRKEAIHVLSGQADLLWQGLSDQDWISYQNQVAAVGEEAALRWLVGNAGHN